MVYWGGWKVEGAADISGFTLALSAGVDSAFMIIDHAYLLVGSGYKYRTHWRGVTIVGVVDVTPHACGWG
jgi:hypothetical protein